MNLYKDQILNDMAETVNVAQFVSFAPDMTQRFCRILGLTPNHKFKTVGEAVETLLNASPEHSVNVRCFKPEQLQGNEFHYGLTKAATVVDHVLRLAGEGYHTIINETIDVNDGGVSGVSQGSCVEFAPGVTPRFVENAEGASICSLPKAVAEDLLGTVYNCFPVQLDFAATRVEFSIHPSPRGWKGEHVVIWETGPDLTVEAAAPEYTWPNGFSVHIGDKAYGLLMAYALGYPVPRTTVYDRKDKIRPFTFGYATGSRDIWTRTCPSVPVPGKFSTVRGYLPPFQLMKSDDPAGLTVVSCLVQEGVRSVYSGAVISTPYGAPVIEGVEGFGDAFMQGCSSLCVLPQQVADKVEEVHRDLRKKIGPTKFEWAWDGNCVWILQLHVGASQSFGKIIFPGTPDRWREFRAGAPLDDLRDLVARVKCCLEGVRVIGRVGLTSHIADILRKAEVPSIIVGDNKNDHP